MAFERRTLLRMNDDDATVPTPTLPALSRRTLLKTSLPVLAAAGLGIGCGGARLPRTMVTAGPLDAFGPGAPHRLEGYDVFILRSDAGLAAVSGRCPHAGCGVGPADGGGFSCGCHGSTFSEDGTVTRGPAEADLTWYAVRVEGGDVIVDPTEEVAKGTYTPM